MSDTPRTNFVAHETGDSEWDRSINRFGRMMAHACILERELAALRTYAQATDATLEQSILNGLNKDEELTDINAALQQAKERVKELERELAATQAQRDKAVAAFKYYLNAAEKREKEASAIINSLTADIHITLPFRNGTEMSPKDCYVQGIMDGVAALKSQINAAIDAAMGEKK